MSAIDITKPVFGTPTTASVRDNFAIAKEELEEFQDYADVTKGDALIAVMLDATGSVARTQHEKNGDVVSVLDFYANGVSGVAVDPTGVVDSTLGLQAAFNSLEAVLIPDGTYKYTQTLLIPAGQKVQGAGNQLVNLVCSADVVGVRLNGLNADIKDLKLTKSGTHTNNLLEVGSAVVQAGRNVIERLWVEGAGNDNLSIRYGSLGAIRDCTFLSGGRDGINFTTETNSTNAWSIDGYNDIRGNTRDGLHLESGSSQTDANAAKSNVIRGIVCQNNGRYGVYCGTRSNSIEMYGEANTTKDLFLDTFAYGNEIVLVEGAYTNNGTGNEISYHNLNAVYTRGTVTRQVFSGASTAGWQVWNDDGAAGHIIFHKTGAGSFEFLADGSSANQTLSVKHNDSSFKLNLTVTGDIKPIGRLLGSQGIDVVSANNLVLGGDGNFFPITGTTQINLISVTGWTGGSVVYLVFASGATVKHNQSGSGANRQILLAGGVDFVATANDTLTLIYHSGNNCWYEFARAII